MDLKTSDGTKLFSITRSSWRRLRDEIRSGSMPIVDLRSPKEYARGRIPEAVNIPLLDDAERHRVGLTYKTVGKTEATQIGLELFACKSSNFLSQLDQAVGPDNALVLYCWRGGMRSNLVASWLAAMGYHVHLLEGGYKMFRREILSNLDRLAQHELLVLNGRTGSGKTDIIQELLTEGSPVIDLEGLASHRGSAFGGFAQAKMSPTQQDFENSLVDRYLEIDSHPVILIEIENYIGPIAVPKGLRENICRSKMIFVSRDFDDRVRKLADTYVKNWDETQDAMFIEKMELLSKFISQKDRRIILDAVERRDFAVVVEALLKLRYDRSYDKGLKKHESQRIANLDLTVDWAGSLSLIRQKLGGAHRALSVDVNVQLDS